MSSAARSPDPTLSGPVEVCVDRPVLSLDRPFTYDLPADLGGRVGSIVQVAFHGRRVHGWVLGPSGPVPRMQPVRGLLSPVPAFDVPMLRLLRWMAERYVAPLAAVVDRAVPPRVAGEEADAPDPVTPRFPAAGAASVLPDYGGGADLLRAIGARTAGAALLRPGPTDGPTAAVEAVGAALAGGRSAIVLVPEADPLPATAAAIRDAYGEAVALFLGGDRRERYRMWLDIRAGRYAVVVGTRPAVFAPVPDLGLVYVSREGHGQYREERSPHAHAREVAAARARLEGAMCILEGFVPTLEARALARRTVEPRSRVWPPVEVVRPGPEGRAPRLVRALRDARRGLLYEPMPGYGVARVCRSCGEAATCASCRGLLRASRGAVACAVCGAPGRCAACGGGDFGVARGGVERVEEWARGVASVPVRPAAEGGAALRGEEIVVGGLEALKDVGPVGADLVGILSADAALRRPGIAARERALVAWSEAAAWAAPDGTVVVQTDAPNDPAVQALVAASPERFSALEGERLSAAGFPPGAPVFRIEGSADLPAAIDDLPHHGLLVSGAGDATVCLLVLARDAVPAFAVRAHDLATRGVLRRVEAEPHL